MRFKLLQNGCNFICGVRSCSNKSRLLCYSQRMFSSDQKSDGPDREAQLKELLNKSSPLKPVSNEPSFWATEPHLEDTVFRKFDDDEETEDLTSKSVIMFPGQGNQFVGMAKNIIKYSVVQDMFASASQILGYDLLKICNEGPEERLNKTKYCQPATFVCSLGALEILKEDRPWVINNCVAACGYSLGELTALVFAGCVSFEKGVSLVKLRAEAMELCAQAVPSGMLTLLLGTTHKLSDAIKDAIEHCKAEGVEDPVCQVATELMPGCKIVAGNIEALNFIGENAKKYGIKRWSKLNVSGAFHTEIMKDAGQVFRFEMLKTEIRPPLIKIYSNVTGRAYRDDIEISKLLPKQIYKPVKWHQLMQEVFSRPKGSEFPYTYECGPGMSLKVALKKINEKAGSMCYSVQL